MRKETVQFEYMFLDLVIEGTYTEEEEQTRDYPGSPADFEIDKIYLCEDIKESDLYTLLEKADCIDEIKEKAIEFINK